MSMTRMVAGLFALGVLGAGVASSQDYPNKPIRILTAGAGGGNDFAARIIAQGLSSHLGQQVIVDNRSGVLAGELTSKAPPDGYTLMVSGAGFWIRPLLQKSPYDAVSDFYPISLLVREVYIVAVHPSVPAKSIKELIDLAKARPGELNFGTSAVGGTEHLNGELFKSMAGINIVHVPYKSAPATITAQIGGEVQPTISDAGLVAPHAKLGKLRALAVTSATQSALVPGLPTMSGTGLPGYEAVGRTGLFAPAKSPTPVINRLNQEVVSVLALPDAKERFLNNAGVETVGSSPEEFAATIKSDIARIGKVIKDAGIKID